MNLTVYLTNACNMGCRYCSVAVNQGPKSTLDAASLHRALDFFIDKVEGKEKEVTFTGGEPLMRWDLLCDGLEHLRERNAGVTAMVLTNATLLDPEKLERLLDLGARVVVSLDGEAGTNDVGRVFFKKTGSTYAAVAKRLESLPKDRLEVQMTITRANVDGLAAGVRHFYEMGFRSIHFMPELFSDWDAKAIAELDKQLAGVAKFLARLDKKALAAFRCAPLVTAQGRLQQGTPGEWWKRCDTIVLGDDAAFYSCHSSQMAPEGRSPANRVGDTAKGFDQKRWEAGVRKAGAFLDTVEADYSQHVHCPMLFYHAANVKGGSGAESIRHADAVARVFSRGMREMAERVNTAAAR